QTVINSNLADVEDVHYWQFAITGGEPQDITIDGMRLSGNFMEKKVKKTEEFWQFEGKTTLPDDPLLGCLLTLTKIYNKPASAQVLTTGLPLVNHRLTPDLFKRAAARAGLSAKIVKRKLSQMVQQQLPAVLLLKNAQTCILNSIKKKGVAEVIQPDAGGGCTEIPLVELAKSYIGYAIFVKPIYHFEDAAEPAQLKQKHWFWGVMKQAVPIYSEVILASFLINLFTIASPLFVMNVYDRVVPNNAHPLHQLNYC
ncbi:unnamed protein product, partial [marine sediment metagenome]